METTENQTSKDHLLLFIEHLGIGQTKFEKLCGLSNGYVSAYWLLTGKGEMF